MFLEQVAQGHDQSFLDHNLLKGKNILIIGYGNIGKKVHHYLKNFNTNILIYDPFKKSKLYGCKLRYYNSKR